MHQYYVQGASIAKETIFQRDQSIISISGVTSISTSMTQDLHPLTF